VTAVTFTLLLIGSTIRIATPIGLAAVAATHAERAGVINVGIDGCMLFGAFGAVYGSYLTDNAAVGMVFGVGAGALASLLLGVFCVVLKADQIVAGMALNISALGLTRFGLDEIWGKPGVSPQVPGLPAIHLPGLSAIPVAGDSIFTQNLVVLALVPIVLGSHLLLIRAPFGVHTTAVGELPSAAASVGISVWRIRLIAMTISGALAGLGGVALSLGQLTYFVEGMTAGRGFIGLAANILGRWRPLGALAAALLFGCTDALQLSLQVLGVELPAQALLILPYLVTVVVLAASSQRARAPTALGQPYEAGAAA
jgi:simple sugar transport system permease protein